MLGYYPEWFAVICWRFIAPIFMTLIAIYTFVFFELPTDGSYPFPTIAHVFGWILVTISLMQVPIFAFHKIYRRKGDTWWEVSNQPLNFFVSLSELPFFRKSKNHLNLQHIGGH